MSNRRQPVYPDCYGHLHDELSEQCQCCLLRDACSAVVAPDVRVQKTVREEEVPTDKKRLIIAICRKYGISTKYYSNKEERWIDVEEEPQFFTNMDFIMTSKEALTRILTG